MQANFLEGRAGYVLLKGCVSVIISYSSRWLTTETVKYIKENSFIENLAALKNSKITERQTNVKIYMRQWHHEYANYTYDAYYVIYRQLATFQTDFLLSI